VSPEIIAAPTPLFTEPLAPDKLKKAIANMLDRETVLPEGQRGAFVTVVNLDRIEVAVVAKVAEGWSVDLVASHAWTGENQFSVLSKVTW
jgi:hypothetical protein